MRKRKIAAKYVPHLLSDKLKVVHMTIAAFHLHRFRSEADIIACDKTFRSEATGQTPAWIGEESPTPMKAIHFRTASKVMQFLGLDRCSPCYQEDTPRTGRRKHHSVAERWKRKVLEAMESQWRCWFIHCETALPVSERGLRGRRVEGILIFLSLTL